MHDLSSLFINVYIGSSLTFVLRVMLIHVPYSLRISIGSCTNLYELQSLYHMVEN